jgi:hypothetical protein
LPPRRSVAAADCAADTDGVGVGDGDGDGDAFVGQLPRGL